MDCTDLCNRLKIALVLDVSKFGLVQDALKFECIPITTLCPVCLIALSQYCDQPGGTFQGLSRFGVSPLLGMPCFKAPSQIPPKLAALHRLRFSLRGMPVQMGGKQAFGVWQYTFITGQRKSAEPAKTRLCAGVICCLVLGAGLDVQNLADGFIIAVMLLQLRLVGFNLLFAHR